MAVPPGPANPYHPAPDQPTVDQLRLWSGGLVTAVVLALLTLVIWWVVRDVLDIPATLPLDDSRGFATDAAVDDAVAVFVGTLVATALLDALLLLTPTPMRFFAWLVGLATVVLVLAPWTTDGDVEPKLARSIGTAVVGLALHSLLAGSARRSLRIPPPTRW